ncbi:DUF2971 domain-containing protein [Mycobacteroides abscessus]|uniref:DUF2971 domain-containing protein n=1 Tax=Mycobacteroides abscessus TaxID=36809 RepID=UPI000C25DBFF|nr:DUF2971 domain-containing protein [Mycobacteroides abscessus]
MSTKHAGRRRLYHYTDANGLLGIVNPSYWHLPPIKQNDDHHRAVKLLASDVRFMNDTEELSFGAQLLRQYLHAAVVNPSTPEDLRAAFADIEPFLASDTVSSALDWPYRCLATCFCADGDLLSQWRGYAGGTGGFALGLDVDGLKQRSHAFHRNHGPNNFFQLGMNRLKLEKVVYGEANGMAAIEKHIESFSNSFWRDILASQDARARPRIQRTLFSLLVQALMTIKSDAFEEEHEWRLYTESDADWPVDVRARSNGLVPYVEIGVNMPLEQPDKPETKFDHDAQPTIIDLVVGPGPTQPEQVLAAKELLKVTGHNPAVVRPSRVSYRG